MIPAHHLEADLRDSLTRIASAPLAEILLQYGILRRFAEDHLRRRLRDQVVFSPEEEPLVISRLWQGIATDPPAHLGPGWIEALPEMLQGPVRERWDQIRLQKWMEESYRDQVEPYFLERRDDLEQVVYGMIRLRNQGAAEELYLRLLDDQADFGELARSHSLGEERFTRGLVGPMRISQPHPTIRAVLQKLAVGDLHPPFAVDNWILLVRMEHRQPARLNDTTQLQLCEELLKRDLDALLDAQLQELYPQLLAAWPGLGAAPSAALQSPALQPPDLQPEAASMDPATLASAPPDNALPDKAAPDKAASAAPAAQSPPAAAAAPPPPEPQAAPSPTAAEPAGGSAGAASVQQAPAAAHGAEQPAPPSDGPVPPLPPAAPDAAAAVGASAEPVSDNPAPPVPASAPPHGPEAAGPAAALPDAAGRGGRPQAQPPNAGAQRQAAAECEDHG